MSHGKVLIVEDQPELAEMLRYQFQVQGFATMVAEDGLNACRLAGSEHPDLIILDILLPDLDGWEVCSLIRSRKEYAIGTVPIIMLTALDSMNDRLRGLETGADAYISKPYSTREVMLTARRLIERRQREQSLNETVTQMQTLHDSSGAIQDIFCHEVRNQLMILRGFSTLLSRTAEVTEERSQTWIQAIERSTQSLANLADSLLQLHRHETGDICLAPDHPQVAAVAEEILDLYRPFAEQRRLEFHLHADQDNPNPAINGVGLRLILSNLIENAVKYSPDGTAIEVHLSTPPATRLQVVVEDHGPGIPEGDQSRIFQRFVRGAASPDKPSGSGLGLYIAKTLAQVMGGDLTFESRRPNGSRFVATFPLPQ